MDRLERRELMATAGGLDASFGAKNKNYFLLTALGGSFEATSTAIAPDDSVYVAGYISKDATPIDAVAVAHLTSSGVLDTSFGDGGLATLTPSELAPGSQVMTKSILVRSDGKLVVAAYDNIGDAPGGVILATFDATGTPDTAFGADGSSLVTLPASAGSLVGGYFTSVTLQPDNQIILAGSFEKTLDTSPTSYQTYVGLVRVGETGTIDTSFGTDGVATGPSVVGSDASAVGVVPEGLAVQPDGQILVVANVSTSSGSDPSNIESGTIARLNSDGSVDTAFGQNASGAINGNYFASAIIGNSSVSLGPVLIAQPDGKILINTVGTLFRLNSDGTLDQAMHYGLVSSIALQPNGDVLLSLGGNAAPSGGANSGDTISFSVTRLTPNLAADPTFGNSGISGNAYDIISLPPGSVGGYDPSPIIVNLAVGPNNRAVVLASASYLFLFVAARLTSGAPATPGDLTGDGIADPAIYLPSIGGFAVRPSSGGPDQITPFGFSGAGGTIPAIGDYTGAGYDQIAAYLPSIGAFAIRPASGPDEIVPFGFSGPGGTIPAVGDYFGTGQDDIAAYLPSIGAFAIRNPGGPDEIIPFGFAGAGQSIPVPGDYDGSGKTELAVYLPSLGEFAYRPAGGGPDALVPFGFSGAGRTIPAVGDYDGSGRTEIGAYLPSLGEFVYRPAKGGADVFVPFGIAGAGQSIPMVADYDGSGRDEVAAYLPSLGVFAYRPAGGGPDVLEQFGVAGLGQTLPVTGASASYVPGVVPSLDVTAASAGSIEVPNIVALDVADAPVASAKKHAPS